MAEEVRHNRACIWLFFLIVAVQKENSPKPTFGMKSVFAQCMQGAYDHYKSHKKKKCKRIGGYKHGGRGAACNSAAMPCKVNGGIRLAEAKSVRGGGPQYQPQSDRKRLEMMLLKNVDQTELDRKQRG